MHVLIISRKKIKRGLGALILLIILISGMILFLSKTNSVQTLVNNTSNYNSYIDKDRMFSFEYPVGYTITPITFESNQDIIKHVEFEDAKSGLRGFVQVWNLKQPLRNFLEESKKHAIGDFKYYDIKDITINRNNGYENLYSRLGNDDIYYKAIEVFFKKENLMYRMSFFIQDDKWNNKVKNVVDNMINKFKF